MTTFAEYMAFFDRWINYQFPRAEDAAHVNEILQAVGRIVSDPEELAYWAGRDNWSMYYCAKEVSHAE